MNFKSNEFIDFDYSFALDNNLETINFNRVLEERQNFDPVGHYSRPDVTKLIVNRERQSTVEYNS